MREHALHAVGQLHGTCEFRPHKSRNLGLFRRIAADLDGHFAQAFVFDDLTADQECIARRQGRGEPFLDLAKWFAAPIASHPNFERIGVLNGADVHADIAGGARVAQLPRAVRALDQPLPFVIGAQGIATRGAKLQAGVEICTRQRRIGSGRSEFREKIIGKERPRAGGDQDMLAQDIAGACAAWVAVQIAV